MAERRYKAVDPDNGVVARTLEREWKEKLRALETLGQEHQGLRVHEKVDLTEDDRASILSLAKDLSLRRSGASPSFSTSTLNRRSRYIG